MKEAGKWVMKVSGGEKGTQMDINPWKRQKRKCNKVRLITEIEIA